MGPSGWAAVAAAGALVVGATNLAILRAITSGRLRRNHFVGIRTARTMRDDETWAVAHQAAVPSFRWSIVLSVLTAAVVLVVGQAGVSAFALLAPVAPMVVGGLQGQAAARRHQQGGGTLDENPKEQP